jgi:hypothetical protein
LPLRTKLVSFLYKYPRRSCDLHGCVGSSSGRYGKLSGSI